MVARILAISTAGALALISNTLLVLLGHPREPFLDLLTGASLGWLTREPLINGVKPPQDSSHL